MMTWILQHPLIEYLQYFPVGSDSKDHVKHYGYTDELDIAEIFITSIKCFPEC